MHERVAEIILSDHLTPEGGVLPPFTQMTNKQINHCTSQNRTH